MGEVSALPFVRYWSAGSTDRRTTGIKTLRRGFKLQGSRSHFASRLRINCNSCRRFALVFG
jgi:hypothetical protein